MSVAGGYIPPRSGTLVKPLPTSGSLDLNEKDDCFRRGVERGLRLIRPLDSAQEDESPRRLVPKSEGEGVVEVEFDFFG